MDPFYCMNSLKFKFVCYLVLYKFNNKSFLGTHKLRNCSNMIWIIEGIHLGNILKGYFSKEIKDEKSQGRAIFHYLDNIRPFRSLCSTWIWWLAFRNFKKQQNDTCHYTPVATARTARIALHRTRQVNSKPLGTSFWKSLDL